MNETLKKTLSMIAACSIAASIGFTTPAMALAQPSENSGISLTNAAAQADTDFVIADGTLTAYNGTATDVVIPDSVTAIAADAFQGNSDITSVTLPANLTAIPDSAFNGCRALENVIFPADSHLTSIGANAFYGCSNLKSLTLPEGVTSIGTKAFASLGIAFKEINLPSTVNTLGDSIKDVFTGSTGLQNVNIAEGNSSWYSYDGALYQESAIVYCPPYKTGAYTIKDGTMIISANVFEESKLEYVAIPESVESIGANAFYSSQLKSIEIPGSVKTIGEYAFFNSKVRSVILHEGINSIGNNAFTTCYYIIDGVVLPNSLNTLGDTVFGDRDSMKWLYFNNSAATVGNNLVENYGFTIYGEMGSALNTYVTDNLNKVTFADAATFVPTENVSISESTQEMEIDDTVALTATLTNEDATCTKAAWYSTDPAVASVSVNGNTATVTALKAGEAQIVAVTADGKKAVCAVTVNTGADFALDSEGLVKAYRGTETNIVIPTEVEGKAVTGIATEAFKDNTQIESVVIPANVQKIGDRAFKGCTQLKTVEIADGVTGIGRAAFDGCKGLKEITVPASVTDLGAAVFSGCQNLTQAQINAVITALPNELFKNCAALEEVNIPDSIETIGNASFSGCKALAEMKLPASLKLIDENAFASCYSLKSLDVPEGVENIRKFAFFDCTSLEHLSLPASLTKVGFTRIEEIDEEGKEHQYNAVRLLFEQQETKLSCNSLQEIEIAEGNPLYQARNGMVYSKDGKNLIFVPRGVTAVEVPDGTETIDPYAFFICFKLEKVDLPSSLKTVGYNAFHYCEALTDMTLPEGLEYIDNSAFFGVESWNYGAIPQSVKYIGPYAFYECAAESIIVPENITEIYEQTFAGYEVSLKHISLPDNLTKIGNQGFALAKNVEYVILPQKLESIGMESLAVNYTVNYITVPKSVKTIGIEAFKKNTAMTGLYLPSTIESIDDDAAYNCAAGFTVLSDSKEGKAYEFAQKNKYNFILLNTTSDFADGTVWIEGLDKVTAEKEAQIDLSVKELAKDNETIKSALQKGEYVTAFDISAKLTENNASKEVTALDNPVSIIMRIPDNYKSKANKLMLVAADGSSVNVTLEDKYAVAKVNSLGSYALVAKKSSSTIPSGGGGGGAVIDNVTISFDSNGGSSVSSKIVSKDTALSAPAAPTKDGYIFKGWYTDKDLKNAYSFSAKVTKDMTLYAAWEKIADPSKQIILTIGQKNALVFGQTKANDVAPLIANSRTMLPARFVAENLDAKVEWNAKAQTVKITNDKTEIILTIGADTALVNGKSVKLDSPAFIQNGRTYTPLRFICESLGANVEYNSASAQVIITK